MASAPEFAFRKANVTCKRCMTMLGLGPVPPPPPRFKPKKLKLRKNLTSWDRIDNIGEEPSADPEPDVEVTPPEIDPVVERVAALLYILMVEHMGVNQVTPLVEQASRPIEIAYEPLLTRARSLAGQLIVGPHMVPGSDF